MGKVIAIPLTSERRAVVLLAALRRLEAEYPVGLPAAGGLRRRIAGRARTARRRVLRDLGEGAEAALAGAMLGLALAASCTGEADSVSLLGEVIRGAGGLPLFLALGAALGLLISAMRRGLRRDAPHDTVAEAGDLSWLLTRASTPPAGAGDCRVRTSVLRITLPGAAEGRLRAILERADALPADPGATACAGNGQITSARRHGLESEQETGG
jgi:hypothetical protein